MRAGIIGYGRWGPNHARNFSELSCLSAIADTNPARLKAAREKYPGAKARHDFKDAVADSDAVVVATPVCTHYDIVQYALEQGKHVLCEKPLCLTAEEARDLHGLAREKRRVLMTGYTCLYNARAQWVRFADLGRIYSIQTDIVNLGPMRSDVGVVADLATHHLALIQSWLGRALAVSATGVNCLGREHEDVATLCLMYTNGVCAFVHVSWLAPRKSRLFRVVGEKCTIEWDDADVRTPIRVYPGGARPRSYYDSEAEFMHLSAWTGNCFLPGVPHIEPLRSQAKHFLHVVETGAHSFASFDEGICATLEAAHHSMAAMGVPIFIQ